MEQVDIEQFLRATGSPEPLRLHVEVPGTESTEEIVLRQPFAVLGRGAGSDVVLDHPHVGDRHAYFQRVAGRIFCVDLGSRTGVHWASGTGAMGWVRPGRSVTIGPFVVRGDGQPDETLAGRGATPADAPPTSRAFPTEGSVEGTIDFPDEAEDRPEWHVSRAMVIVGRSELCKIRFTTPDVSKYHCGLVRTPEGFFLVDLRSRKGTIVNGQAVRWSRLDDGDEVSVGNHRFRLRLGAGRSRAAGPPALASRRSAPAAPTRVRTGAEPLRGNPDPGTLISAVPEHAESLVAGLVRELAQSREQMSAQFQQSLLLVIQMFTKMHDEQTTLVRNELEQMRKLTERQQALILELGQRPLPVPDAALPASPPPPPPPPLGDWPARDPGLPRQPSAGVSNEAPGPEPAPPLSVPGGDGPNEFLDAEALHALIVRRLASVESEQTTRWQKLLGTVLGPSNSRKRNVH